MASVLPCLARQRGKGQVRPSGLLRTCERDRKTSAHISPVTQRTSFMCLGSLVPGDHSERPNLLKPNIAGFDLAQCSIVNKMEQKWAVAITGHCGSTVLTPH